MVTDAKAVIRKPRIRKSDSKVSQENDTRLSKASIVRLITETIEHTFGESTMFLMRVKFPAYEISFDDGSIVDKPERFTEAIFYTFGSAADLIFEDVNKSLMLYAPINPVDDMTKSGSAGFVLLIYKIRNTYGL